MHVRIESRRFAKPALQIALATLLGVQPALAQVAPERCNPSCLARRARAALAAGRHADYLRLALQLAARAPDHTGVSYAVARGFALVGQHDSALAWLSHVAERGGGQSVASDSAFAALRATPAFRALQSRFETNAAPIVRGKPAFALADPDLLPEALAWDPTRRVWLVGSQAKRKVISVAADGSSADLFSSPDMLRLVGIHVDPARQHVWFATWAPSSAQRDVADSDVIIRTRLFKADLTTARILRSYQPADTTNSHLLNDLAIAPNGTVYITDTQQGSLYRIAPDSDSLEVFLRPDPGNYAGANGITLSDDGRTLYAAFLQGILRIDITTGQFAPLRTPAGVNTSSIDGLYWYRGDLVAVQNSPGLERVVRFELDAHGGSVQRADVLERSTSLLKLPTTGAIVGTRFFYIANSQIERLDDTGRLAPPGVTPAPLTVIRVIDLDDRRE
jgi:hypothetical protein